MVSWQIAMLNCTNKDGSAQVQFPQYLRTLQEFGEMERFKESCCIAPHKWAAVDGY
jgi:hypothetical protein